MGISLLVIAGEASGDAHAAAVISALRKSHSSPADLECFGLGGEQLQRQGLEPVADSSILNTVGLSEVLHKLPAIFRLRKQLLEEVKRRQPRAALLVDLPGFNLNLAKKLKGLDVPVIYYIAPQAWAWREGRVKKIRKRVQRLCVVFPFEQDFFARHEVPVEFVGHPLTERRPDRVAVEQNLVAIVPGSRPREIDRLLPPLAAAARLLLERNPELKFVLPPAPGIERQVFEHHLQKAGIEARFVEGGAPGAFAGARLGLVTSGTAALEGALARVPMVVVYRVSRTTYSLVRPIYKLPFFCIVNIMAGREVVPELLQGSVDPAGIAKRAQELLPDGPARQATLDGLDEVVASLGTANPSERVAAIISGML